MGGFGTELKIGVAALLVTVISCLFMILMWYEDHSVTREFVKEIQRLSPASPSIGFTEGQLAEWTGELRKTETAKGEIEAHFAEQVNKMRNHEYTEKEFIQHVVNCQKFCGQLLDKMIAANTEEMTKVPHDVIFFDINKDALSPRYQQRVRDFVSRNKKESLVMVGRASRIGGTGYNKALSGRRVKSVTRVLKMAGIRDEQIKSLWIGFEAPQLTRALADLYRIDPNEYKGDLFQLNQSVVLCTSPSGVFFPTLFSSMEEQVQKKKPAISKISMKQRG